MIDLQLYLAAVGNFLKVWEHWQPAKAKAEYEKKKAELANLLQLEAENKGCIDNLVRLEVARMDLYLNTSQPYLHMTIDVQNWSVFSIEVKTLLANCSIPPLRFHFLPYPKDATIMKQSSRSFLLDYNLRDSEVKSLAEMEQSRRVLDFAITGELCYTTSFGRFEKTHNKNYAYHPLRSQNKETMGF